MDTSLDGKNKRTVNTGHLTLRTLKIYPFWGFEVNLNTPQKLLYQTVGPLRNNKSKYLREDEINKLDTRTAAVNTLKKACPRMPLFTFLSHHNNFLTVAISKENFISRNKFLQNSNSLWIVKHSLGKGTNFILAYSHRRPAPSENTKLGQMCW